MDSKYWGTEVAYKNGYAAGAKDAKFYVVDAKTGENRGSIIMDEYDEAAQEAHDNLVRGLIEANEDVVEGRRLLVRALDQLYLLGYDSGFTNPAIEQLVTDIKFYLNGGKLNGT